MDTKVEGTDPLLGSRIAGRYTVMRRIARGGMGVVYLAVQDGLQRTVALKVIRGEAAADPVMQKRFEREARAVSQLAHPNIVTVHDFGKTDDGSLYLAMEFVDGEVLRDALRRKKTLTFAETLPVVESVCAALARAHAAGVVHRDLKPENVMLPRQSTSNAGAVAAKVLDFGLAKPHDPDLVDEHLTRDGGFVGTPGYASPEQTEGGPEDPRQDLYSLGIVWFELLAGEHPFAAPTPMKIVVRQLHEEAPALPAHVPGVPPAAASLLRRLMARRADDRPASALAVLEELAALRTVPAAPAATAAPAPAVSAPVETPTIDDRAQRPPAPVSPPAVTPSFLPVDDPPSRLPWLVAGVLVAAAAGALLVWTTSATTPPATTTQTPRTADAGAGGAHGDGVEVVLEGVPTFGAFQALRPALPGSVLEVYAKERSVLRVADVEAGAVADALQGRALTGDVPLVLEVKELVPGRVVVAAVPPDQASVLKDAGLLLDGGAIADAGPLTVIAPGGLSP